MALTFVPEYDFVRGTGHLPGQFSLDVPLVGAPMPGAAPDKFSLREVFPELFPQNRQDQRRTNSCTGQLAGRFEEVLHKMATGEDSEMSELFAYNLGRHRRGWLNQDSGALISDVFNVAAVEGCPLRGMMPFDERLLYSLPDEATRVQAARHRLKNVRALPRDENIIRSVLSGGGDPKLARPVGVGFIVYQHRWFAPDVLKTGWIDAPSKTSDYGGWHALMLFGYNKVDDTYDGENWWGNNWAGESVVGLRGCFRISGQYIRDPRMSNDFVTADAYTTEGDEQ